ncbi:ribonuclease subunit b [Diplodia corticola]|uniref:Ribonuclease H2 subunit B n=1 Tax=Diplodia corticola TaxID=236234 RepID=A0A1J9SLN2_9PEZI|nr:ribonuclease subunit b [Diplodia corticola]OJD40628.1 ribonuclease subunit b [Diplodia corticola]
MKTRSKKPSAKNDAPEKTAPAAGPAPPTADPNPPKLFVLPRDVSSQAHIVTLPNPASSSANRYFCCPSKGFYEFTRVAAPKSASKSWLLAPQRYGEPEQRKEADNVDGETVHSLRNGYTLKSPDIFVATPVDALFLALPALVPSAKGGEKQLFLSVEDHMDSLGSSCAQLRKLLENDTLRTRVEERMAAACDTVDAGDEKMFRLSIEKLARELLAKAERFVGNGLPASMEEKFVRKALERPVMSIKREDTTVSLVSEDGEAAKTETTTATTTDAEMTTDSQKSDDYAATSAMTDQQTTSPAQQQPIDAPEGIPHLLRLRTAIDFISSSYLPPSIRALLQPAWSSNSMVDFDPLDKHLQELATLRSEAQALRSLSDNITRKHGMEDDEAAAMRAEKKRKKDEEEVKKKNQSRGVKQLAKADTSGMKKLSSFFTKAPVKK